MERAETMADRQTTTTDDPGARPRRIGRRARRAATLGLAVGLLATGLIGITSIDPGPTETAAADVPVATPGATPAVDLDSLDPLPIKQWGVVGSGTSFSSAKPEVWDFAELGDVMFVAGNFTGVQRDADDPTSNVIQQSYLAAFNRDSGEWISTFRPTFNRTIYALEVAPNGKLLVGGEFTTVNGTARAGIVMLDPTTGEIDANFRANADGGRPMVREIVRAGSQIYVAGQFSYMHGFPADPWLWNAARLDALTGRVDLAWIPKFAGGLWDITVDNDRGHVTGAGYFTSVNGQPNTALLASVSMTNGGFLPNMVRFTPNQSNQTDTTSVVYANNRLYVGGAQHIVQVLDAGDHRRVGYNTIGIRCSAFSPRDCGTFYGGGDIQTMEVTANGIVLAGCHCFGDQYVSTSQPLHYSSFTNSFSHRRYALAYDALDSRPKGSFNPGLRERRWGTYAIDTDTRGCYYVGGDYNRRSDGRWIGGFGRFCRPVVPPTGLSGTSAAGSVSLRWTAAATQLPVSAYKVYRNGTFLGDVTGTTFGVAGLAAGSTHTFTVVTRDVSGRLSPAASTTVTVNGAPTPDTQAPTVPANTTGAVNGSSVTLNWGASTDLPDPGGVGLSGYLIHRDGVYQRRIVAGTTTALDENVPNGAHRYEIRAVDRNNNMSAPARVDVTIGAADTQAPTVPASPTGSVNGTTVTLNWGASTDLPDPGGAGLSGYLVHKDWAYLKFVPAGELTTTDLGVTPGTHRYEIRAVDRANNISAPAAPIRVTVP